MTNSAHLAQAKADEGETVERKAAEPRWLPEVVDHWNEPLTAEEKEYLLYG